MSIAILPLADVDTSVFELVGPERWQFFLGACIVLELAVFIECRLCLLVKKVWYL